ncbi:CYTH domain-containing protein [Aureivirga sp. CE67]|uniref:CYTH domain-containing protein n=1 Tax=Aureivirga sp. CE67 TaxID=1788983 RepID=UPI0018C9C1F3|nr:CYTH domain-containing protein [Aureivirga sp. CE67]
MQEIERKFLVKNDDFKKEAFDKKYIKQAFLNSDKNRTVRVRVKDEEAFLTIKGISNQEGTTRFEWEKEISVEEATSLFHLCEKGEIEKYRFLIKSGKHTFEVDEFLGENEGLLIAEVELESENETFEKPDWLGKEVTGDIKYYNSCISKNPYKNW